MDAQIRQEILEAIRGFEAIVDGHEHLGPERDRLAVTPDVCCLFAHYLTGSLHAAGFETGDGKVLSRGQVREFLLDTSRPVEERFAVLERFIPAVRDTSYAEAMWRTLRDVYGFRDITRDNFMEITQAMRAANKPGLYDEIMVNRCRIKYALTQCGHADLDKPFLVPVLNFALLQDFPEGRVTVERRGEAVGMNVNTLSDYLELCRAQLAEWRDNHRVVGMKTRSQPDGGLPTDEEARSLFAKLMAHGQLSGMEHWALSCYLREHIISLCGELDLTVAVHAGVWDDFRQLDPRHNISVILRHPDTRFDIYHMGMPWVRDTVFLGGNWHNVYINWCWSHIVSYYMTQSAMLEYIDFVPCNKINAFGGDYSSPCVEKIYGHLSMAQENVATILARLVRDGRVTVDRAVELARLWFCDNAVRLYRLDRFA
jgi:predicted TIM-barrel fold metal-dependent hydrolase